jgi:hypothetical protein
MNCGRIPLAADAGTNLPVRSSEPPEGPSSRTFTVLTRVCFARVALSYDFCR